MKNSIAVIIPAYKPDHRMVALVKELRENHATSLYPIIIVDDGGGIEFKEIFNQVQQHATVLTHPENKGKGAALKTAFKYIAEELSNQVVAGVTIDADGQHTVKDTINCIQAYFKAVQQGHQPIVLGSRQFDGKIPLRSKFGNVMTRDVLAMSTGMDITDTQTGLRVIPTQYFAGIIQLPGERYELEMQMLVYAKDHRIPLIEVPIETIYLDENESSHFNPVKDSIRIYAIFFKYLVSSVASFLVDIGVFALVIRLLNNKATNAIMIASYVARAASSVFNFTVNKQLVFQQGDASSKLKYFSLVIAQISVSGLLVSALSKLLVSWDLTVVKTVVDIGLFLISYQIQKRFIFTNRKEQ